MKTLTKAEEQIMHILWGLEKAVVWDILEKLPDPKPAYNTISTVVRVLEKKGFVDHKSYGTTYEYFPIISKEEYTQAYFGDFMKKYFNNSFPKMASFFAEENDLSLQELEEIMIEIHDEFDHDKSKS